MEEEKESTKAKRWRQVKMPYDRSTTTHKRHLLLAYGHLLHDRRRRSQLQKQYRYRKTQWGERRRRIQRPSSQTLTLSWLDFEQFAITKQLVSKTTQDDSEHLKTTAASKREKTEQMERGEKNRKTPGRGFKGGRKGTTAIRVERNHRDEIHQENSAS